MLISSVSSSILFCLCLSVSVSPSGQSYEVRMLDNRKPGELPEIHNKMVKVRPTRRERNAYR